MIYVSRLKWSDPNVDIFPAAYRAGFFDRTIADPNLQEGGEPKMVTQRVPSRCLTAADMQGAKSTYGMLAMSHSVRCKLGASARRGRGGASTSTRRSLSRQVLKSVSGINKLPH